VAGLLPLPFLQTYNAVASSLSGSWVEGFCPSAGPGRPLPKCRHRASRYFRCARCGESGMHARYTARTTDTSDHGQLVTLIAENGGLERDHRCLHALPLLRQDVDPLQRVRPTRS